MLVLGRLKISDVVKVFGGLSPSMFIIVAPNRLEEEDGANAVSNTVSCGIFVAPDVISKRRCKPLKLLFLCTIHKKERT